MPHLAIQYTPNALVAMPELCDKLAKTIASMRDADGKAVFPVAGIRVLAYPAAHFAVADAGCADAFVYLNLRIAKGRSPQVLQAVGAELRECVLSHCAPALAAQGLGITLQIDEGVEVFDAKIGNLHQRRVAALQAVAGSP